MGLDAIEIVMDVEEHFGITIQDAEAEQIRTVGQFVALLHDRVSAAHETPCPTLPAFLKLRTLLRDITGNDTFRMRPCQLIADRLNATYRRHLWGRLPELLGSPPHALRRPKTLRRILSISTIALLGIALYSAAAIDFSFAPLTLAIAAFGIFGLHIVTVSFRTFPPDDWVTFGDVTTKIVGTTSATKHLQLRTVDDILNELRPLIVQALGVDADEVFPNARFVEDLGVG